MKKTESVAEFIARGGTIRRVEAVAPVLKPDNVKSTTNTGGAIVIMSMDDADLYYGEHRAKKAKKRVTSVIDLSALPEELRKKYVDEVISGHEEDSDEED